MNYFSFSSFLVSIFAKTHFNLLLILLIVFLIQTKRILRCSWGVLLICHQFGSTALTDHVNELNLFILLTSYGCLSLGLFLKLYC